MTYIQNIETKGGPRIEIILDDDSTLYFNSPKEALRVADEIIARFRPDGFLPASNNIPDRLLGVLQSRCNKIVTYRDIQQGVPELVTRGQMSNAVTRLRRSGYTIVNEVGLGYRFLPG